MGWIKEPTMEDLWEEIQEYAEWYIKNKMK